MNVLAYIKAEQKRKTEFIREKLPNFIGPYVNLFEDPNAIRDLISILDDSLQQKVTGQFLMILGESRSDDIKVFQKVMLANQKHLAEALYLVVSQ